MPPILLPLRRRHPSIRTLGIAAEYYPRYVNRKLALHGLDVVLLSFIVRGRGWHHIEQDRFAERGASLAVTHYGQRHDIITSPRGMDIINIYLDLSHHVLPILPGPLQQVLPLLLPLHPRFVHSLNRIVRIQFDDPAPLAAHLMAIMAELHERPRGWEEAVMLHWKLFLMSCCRHVLDNGFVPPVAGPSRIEALRLYLDEHYAQPQSLDALARRARLSPTSLCRAFKNHTGKSVFEYLIDRRIQAAMLRLRNSNDKVLTIALDAGFTDLSFFNRKFRSIVGTTPRAYREQLAASPTT